VFSMEEASNNDADVFVYMGAGGPVAPRDIVRVRVHPSVTIIPEATFQGCNKLEEVELSEGLLEIGEQAFRYCTALKHINIPSTVTMIRLHAFSGCKQLEELELCEGLQIIGDYAFFECNSLKRLSIPDTVRNIGNLAFCHAYQLQHLRLPEGIESIGAFTFSHNRCAKCRIPTNFTTLTRQFIGDCKSMFSIELSEDVTDIRSSALDESHSLRNIAFPANAEVWHDIFDRCVDLQRLYFETEEQLVFALKHRFDNLPIHKMIYYQSYEPVSVDQLNHATGIQISQRRSKIDRTGSQQDCLGMTPLHILACSTVQNIQLYKVLIDKYPDTLITKDRWDALPLFYAIWGNAPGEIVRYLVDSYKSLYPDHEFNWTDMMVTLVETNTPKENVLNLYNVHRTYFREHIIDWANIIGLVCSRGQEKLPKQTLRLLIQCSVSMRIDTIGVRQWREYIKKYIQEAPIRWRDRRVFKADVEAKLVHYESEYLKLKETTSLIELALWKHKMNDNNDVSCNGGSLQKRAKVEESAIGEDYRGQCHVSCGADIVIHHMLPYLVSTAQLTNIPTDVDFYSDDDSDSDY